MEEYLNSTKNYSYLHLATKVKSWSEAEIHTWKVSQAPRNRDPNSHSTQNRVTLPRPKQSH